MRALGSLVSLGAAWGRGSLTATTLAASLAQPQDAHELPFRSGRPALALGALARSYGGWNWRLGPVVPPRCPAWGPRPRPATVVPPRCAQTNGELHFWLNNYYA